MTHALISDHNSNSIEYILRCDQLKNVGSSKMNGDRRQRNLKHVELGSSLIYISIK